MERTRDLPLVSGLVQMAGIRVEAGLTFSQAEAMPESVLFSWEMKAQRCRLFPEGGDQASGPSEPGLQDPPKEPQLQSCSRPHYCPG